MIDHARISDFYPVPDDKDLEIERLREVLREIRDQKSCLLADAQEKARRALEGI